MKRILSRLVNVATGRKEQIAAFQRLASQNRVAIALSRAAATAAVREIDPSNPSTWEFSGFSQNGEDGIIDYLCQHVIQKNRFFVEIGSADGLENNSSWLAMAKRYGGLMVEGDKELSDQCRRNYQGMNWAVHCINKYVDADNIVELLKLCPFKNPDFFSLDIDGIDYYIAKVILESGFRPKIVAVEYNSVFGPDRLLTVPYKPLFNRWNEHESGLYYGVSAAGWKKLFEAYGYKFLTVDNNGINSFFIDPLAFPEGFTSDSVGVSFRDNAVDRNPAVEARLDEVGDLYRPMRDWQKQFSSIASMKFVEI